mgnify:CR=1 FL=1|tara:strand:+ start:751 stop:993 length:243 start_codon:yes stop_codon:yes gene_type:complete
MNKYRIEYCEENGIKVKEFNKYNVNNYTNFLENKLAAINYTHSCKSDIELLLAFGKELLPRKQHFMLDKHIALFLKERSK